MQLRIWAAVIALALVPAFSATPASARPGNIERWGNTYARQACGREADGIARCYAKIVTDSAGNIRPGKASADVTRNIAPQGYGPTDLRSAYKVTGSGSSSYTIAIVDAYGYPECRARPGDLPRPIRPCRLHDRERLLQEGQPERRQGSYPRDDTGWAQEQALDLDMASAICPNCKILLVQATDQLLATSRRP